jgi:hypothetical protein
VSLICTHAPTEEKNGNIKDTFYGAVEKAFSNCPRNDVRIILGDFNAQVGYENQGRMVVGRYSLHKESNDNGLRLIGLATALKMVIGSTTFPYKNVHLATWRTLSFIRRTSLQFRCSVFLDGWVHQLVCES